MAKTIEQNWADWEGNAFGFGYGTGEPHTIPALRRFLELCNRDNSGRTYEYETLEAELGAPVAWLLINALCRHGVDLIDYGTSPRYGWLTEKGEGCGLTLILFAEACRRSADKCEADELRRVLSKPRAHFTARNEAKNAAGFRAEQANHNGATE